MKFYSAIGKPTIADRDFEHQKINTMYRDNNLINACINISKENAF